jgi:hypothetical protein
MSNIYFLVDSSNTVINAISWDGDIEKYTPPPGHVVVTRTFDQGWIGSYWIGTKAIDAQPYPSWTLDVPNETWVPPVPMPQDGKEYTWNEETLSWVEVVPPEEPAPSANTQVF